MCNSSALCNFHFKYWWSKSEFFILNDLIHCAFFNNFYCLIITKSCIENIISTEKANFRHKKESTENKQNKNTSQNYDKFSNKNYSRTK